MSNPRLSNTEKVKIAQEVIEGGRDPSDLEKEGISIGDPIEIDVQTLLKQAEAEARGDDGPVDKLFRSKSPTGPNPPP